MQKRRNLRIGKTGLLTLALAWGGLTGCADRELPVSPSASDLRFDGWAASWDEGIPLGNAVVGALIWQRDSMLRFSLDRTDLWDLRPMDSLSGPNYRFGWVREQVRKGDYLPVQKKFDWPYDREPAPSKIPGGALEFPLQALGAPSSVRLYLNNALCRAVWPGGTELTAFVHADKPIGWFMFDRLPEGAEPVIVPPAYGSRKRTAVTGPEAGPELGRLGYEQGEVKRTGNRITYRQEGWGGFFYEIAVQWERRGDRLSGVWSVTSPAGPERAEQEVQDALERGAAADYRTHMAYWDGYWSQASVTLPDTLLQKQYDNEMYKFGSAAREHSYPISLQAVWTADNGKLPPWKGDYHHDLNTQLSYWPAYAGNRLREGLGYLNTLWAQRDVYKRYTRQYFETDGMNVPGVCALNGEPMGGWIQYSMSQTAGAWLAQHFYLHWKYSADRKFLEERAYPFLKETAVFLERISSVGADGIRRLEISSSPEIFDNSLRAWFREMTNYDRALMHFAFGAAAETAAELGYEEEAARWKRAEAQLPDYDLDADGALTFAPGYPYDESHRHFSHAMAIHPLGLLDVSQGEKSRRIIAATLKKLEAYGPDYWTGYSYAWFANLKARAFDGEGAARALRTFAECFCLKNTFHANGDQTRSGKSRFTYRPFTLEGNFAFAAAVHEMLLQSHTGTVRLFPAVPQAWRDVSFRNLRAQGAFLISARREGGKTVLATVMPEQGGDLKLAWPGNDPQVTGCAYERDGETLTLHTRKGEPVTIR